MGYFNFPHTRNYDTDLGWLIHRVKELSDQDNSYVNDITSPKGTLDVSRIGRQFNIDVKPTSEDVTKSYVDYADANINKRINELDSKTVGFKDDLQEQITNLVNKDYIDTITSSDGSIGINKVGSIVDIKFLKTPGGFVTQTYVDEKDKELNDKIDLKLDRNTYIEKMTLLDQMDANQNKKLEEMWSTIYPIGSIYMNIAEVDPHTLFGGTWEKIQNAFLYGSGDHTLGEMGGEETHTLTIDEMPKHRHLYSDLPYRYDEMEVEGTSVYKFQNIGSGAVVKRATTYEGNDTPHNNMPPYLVVNMWKRTA